MTADEWDTSDDPRSMIAAASERAPWRKWRLFAVAASRDARRFHLLPAVLDAIGLAERFADGLVDAAIVQTAYHRCRGTWDGTELPLLLAPVGREADTVLAVTRALDRVEYDPPRRAMWLREVIGNPFRWVRWEDEWVTRTVHALAAPAYAQGRFDGLPVLADALADEGYDNEELLAHLRGPGPHTRGCWALDVVLGKV